MPSPEEITISVSAAAIAISKNLGIDETSLLAAIFTQLGDTLATISIAKQNALAQQTGKSTQSA